MSDAETWRSRGKTVKQLIEELQSFENLDLEVHLSFDEGDTHGPVYLLGKLDGYCVLFGGLSPAETDGRICKGNE